MNKICVISNYAPHYRTNIFMLMDKELSCDFYFGNKMKDIKKMDYSLLKNFKKEVKNVIIHKPVYYQKGVLSLLFKKYSEYIITGETICISTWLFLLLSKIFNKKAYVWTHGWYGKETKFQAAVKRFFFSMAEGVLLYGDYAKQLMMKEGFNEKKLYVVYNSLAYDEQTEIRSNIEKTDIFEEHFKNNCHNLIFAGRLTQGKQIDMLLQALSELKQQNANYNLTLVGDGEMKTKLLNMVQELDIQCNVWFYGATYNEHELSGLFYNADLCVSPGNIGLTAIHAMTYGCPVITHGNFSYQMPEFEAIEKEKTGDFFTYNDANSLVQAIKNWFENNYRRDEIRKKCYRVVDEKYNPHYQLNAIKSALTAIY